MSACLLAAMATASYVAAATVSFEWATVGDTGNADDVSTGYGGVDDFFLIATTEVTNDQYAQYLNSIAASDPNGVWNANMDITRSGPDGGYTYAANVGYGSRALDEASFYDAMRFTNWLENGQPTGVQDATTTEDGTYLISNGYSETRSANASYWLPSEDEWYKAAYYDPSGAVVGNYWDYANQSDTAPTAESPTGGANSANYDGGHGDYTAVGAYTSSTSYYGGYDFGGNVFEWTEGLSGTDRIIRGGDYLSDATTLAATGRTAVNPTGGSFEGGFGIRIAFIPEPSSVSLLGIGALAMLLRRKRG